jgi:hypothetical protein
MSNTTVIFRETAYAETHGGIGIQVNTGANFLGEFSGTTLGYEFSEQIPESFIRALDDFDHGRFVDVETAHNDPPPNA